MQSLLEQWGMYHIERYLSQQTFLLYQYSAKKITNMAIFFSFFTGFFVTVVTVSAEVFVLTEQPLQNIDLSLIVLVIAANIGMISIEFWVLFHIGFQATARYIYDAEKHYPMTIELKKSLVRAIFEFSEPEKETFGLNPYKKRSKHYWIILVLYKIKIMGSNILAKFLLRKVISRGGTRVYIPFIATLITGFWDAWVQASALKEVRLRIANRLYVIDLLNQLKQNRYPSDYIEALIRLIAVRLELFGVYNINLAYLLHEINSVYPQSVNHHDNLYDFDKMTQSYLHLSSKERYRLARTAASLITFKHRFLSQEEKQLLQFFRGY